MFQELCPKEVFCLSRTLLQLEARFEEVLTRIITEVTEPLRGCCAKVTPPSFRFNEQKV